MHWPQFYYNINKSKHRLKLLFVIFTMVLTYMFLHRKDGFEYTSQLTYNELYPNFSKGIETINVQQSNQLMITCRGFSKESKWNLYENSLLTQKNIQLPFVINLKEGKTHYLFQSSDDDANHISLVFTYTPADWYKKKGINAVSNYEIAYSSLPFVSNDSSSVLKYSHALTYTSKEDRAKLSTIIQNEIKILPGDSTIHKIKKISSYIYSHVKNRILSSPDSIRNFSAMKRFELVKQGRTTIWCSDISDIFQVFAETAGITVRTIGITNQYHDFTAGSHSANEFYNKETGEWVYTDLTQNIVFLELVNGKLLNTADLLQIKKMNISNNIKQLSNSDTGLIITDYSNPHMKFILAGNEILYPHSLPQNKISKLLVKAKRQILPVSWVDVYSELKTYSNIKFYMKVLMLCVWFITGVMLLKKTRGTKSD
jgi:hypothetical protein